MEAQDGSGSGALRGDQNTGKALKDFDFLLDNPSKNELEKLLAQKSKLIELDELLPTIQEKFEVMLFQFRE